MKKIKNLEIKKEKKTLKQKKNLRENFFLKTFKKKLYNNYKFYNYSAAFTLIYFFNKYKLFTKTNLFQTTFLENKNNSFYNNNSKKKLNNVLLNLFKLKKIENTTNILKKYFFRQNTKQIINIDKNTLNTNNIIKGFLFIWKTKNNFFVTISDYTGNTLVTWSGGNTGWSGTRQRATVFSADNALYECCYLAKERGLQSVIVHIWSSLRSQQIKHCFDGLISSGLLIDSVIYRPIKAFGGCRPSKPRRV